jgi:hypothetical protein
VLPINYQYFVLTGNTVNQAQAIRDHYVRTVQPLLEKLQTVALPRPLMKPGDYPTDWAGVGTGMPGFPSSDQFGVVGIARQIEEAARRAQAQMRQLVTDAKPAVWKFNRMENGKVYGQTYTGPLKQELLQTALSKDGNWEQLRQRVEPLRRQVAQTLWEQRQVAAARKLDRQA